MKRTKIQFGKIKLGAPLDRPSAKASAGDPPSTSTNNVAGNKVWLTSSNNMFLINHMNT